jgi:predicted PurR-regulated permease PerM
VAAPNPGNEDPPRPVRTADELTLVKMLRWLLVAIFIVVAWQILSTLAVILAPILVALAIAYLLDPVLEWMVKRGIKRSLGALILLVLFLGVITLTLSILIPEAISQVEHFVNDLPTMIDNTTSWAKTKFGVDLPNWKEYVRSPEFKKMMEDAVGPAQELATAALGGVLEILAVLAEMLLIPVFAYYFLVDWPNLTARIKRMIPPRNRGQILEILGQVDEVVSGWVRGQAIVTGLLAVLYAIAFSLIGIHLAIPIGLLVGLLTIIPFVGTFVGAAITLSIVVLDWSGPETLILVGITFVILHILEAAVLTPKITGHKVGLSESGALFAVVAGGKLLGLVGMLLAVPIAATIAVLIRHAYRRYEKSTFFGNEDDAIVPVTEAMAMMMPRPDAPGTRRSVDDITAEAPKDSSDE